MTVTAWQIVAPLSSSGISRANTTKAVEITSFEEYDNTEIEVLDVSRTFDWSSTTPFLYTLTKVGRSINGNLQDLWVNEILTTNFPEYKWKERNSEANDVFTVNWTINSSATTLVLDSTAWLYASLVLRVKETDEHIRIESVTNGTTVVIQRWVWTTAAASITDNDTLLLVGSAVGNWVASTDAFYAANVNKSNYIQKMVTTVSQTDFDRLSYKVGNYADTLMKEKAKQHVLDMERVALFWEKASKTDTSWVDYYTAGWVVNFCKTGWTDDISSSLTIDTLEEAFENSFLYGSQTKYVMCSSKVMRAISGLYRQDLVLNDSIKEIDLTMKSIQMNRGKVTFIIHPLLDSNSWYDNVAFIIDPAFIKVVYPSVNNEWGVNFWVEGKTKFLIDNSKTSPTYMEWSWYTYFTLELANANACWAIVIV